MTAPLVNTLLRRVAIVAHQPAPHVLHTIIVQVVSLVLICMQGVAIVAHQPAPHVLHTIIVQAVSLVIT